MIDGEKIMVGGVEMTAPPIAYGKVKKYYQDIKTLDPAGEEFAPIDKLLEVIHASLSRNYPDLTLEQLADMIFVAEITPAYQKILSISGFKAVAPGELPGESPANPTGTE
jgi:hypothetical protein